MKKERKKITDLWKFYFLLSVKQAEKLSSGSNNSYNNSKSKSRALLKLSR